MPIMKFEKQVRLYLGLRGKWNLDNSFLELDDHETENN